jgi:hypothetical protein
VKPSMKTYTNYSIGCFVVWAVVLAIVESVGSSGTRHSILLVFAGWLIAWISTTIARFVYPPPRKWTKPAAPAQPSPEPEVVPSEA